MSQKINSTNSPAKNELQEGNGKYYGCETKRLYIAVVVIIVLCVGLIFCLAGAKFSGCTVEGEVDYNIKSNYWGYLIEFLPDALGGFLGIFVGFLFEATLFKEIKKRKQRKTVFDLLELELSEIIKSTEKPMEIPIPITEGVLTSVEHSNIMNFKIESIDDSQKVSLPINLIYDIAKFHKDNKEDKFKFSLVKFLNTIDKGRHKNASKKKETRSKTAREAQFYSN